MLRQAIIYGKSNEPTTVTDPILSTRPLDVFTLVLLLSIFCSHPKGGSILHSSSDLARRNTQNSFRECYRRAATCRLKIEMKIAQDKHGANTNRLKTTKRKRLFKFDPTRKDAISTRTGSTCRTLQEFNMVLTAGKWKSMKRWNVRGNEDAEL